MPRGADTLPRPPAAVKPLSLLVLSPHFYPDLSATGQVLTLLCEELALLGVSVEVLCAPSTIPNEKVDERLVKEHRGIAISRLWGTRLPKERIWARLINQGTFTLSVLFRLLMDRSRRPLLVVSNPPWLVHLCALTRGIHRNPYIYLVHDIWPDTGIRLGKIGEKSLLARTWERLNRVALFKRVPHRGAGQVHERGDRPHDRGGNFFQDVYYSCLRR